jgi:bifunctional non-homologous end joining protein LigD
MPLVMSAPEYPTRPELGEYRRKRSFDQTPEPELDGTTGLGGRFVVHEHRARRLHWDLRLEHEGALASWAIPNGIPQDPKHNRKAVHVEDHPLSYIDFQGTIPEGNYGAGQITIWDEGTYECEKWEPEKVVVVFHGKQLQGRYALFHAGRAEKDWMIHRMDTPVDSAALEMPEFIQPMLARLSTLPTDESDWAFEVKWDGVRAITHSQPGRISLISRNGKDVTVAYPELRALNRALGSHEAILDGEIVAFDEQGRPSFQALQSRMHVRGEAAVRRLAQSTPVTYVLFDLLWLDGHSLMDLPYTERRARLQALSLDDDHWRTPKYYPKEGAAFLAASKQQGLEGIIAKRLDSRYTPGGRGGGWLKIKNVQRQELVVGGWTEGKGSRSQRIGALHLGVYQDGALKYAGKLGTGFDAQELELLAGLLEPLARKDSPFTGAQPPKGAHFVEPALVCEVEFTEWTRAGTLRHPSYKGLREDKAPTEVVRERAVAPTELPVEQAVAPTELPVEQGIAPAELPAEQAVVHVELPVGSPGQAANGSMLLEGGHRVRGGLEVDVEDRTLKLTNLGKVLYPACGFTKADLIDYYARIAPVLLPHLLDRPLTLKRYPNGVRGEYFYEKQSPAHRPEWVKTTAVWSEHSKREIHYTLCQDLPTLVWLANLADIELHPSLSLAGAPERPTSLAFDLDPGAPASIVECCEVALELHDMFDELGLHAFAKTSGSKGLQVYVPLNAGDITYEQTKPFAHAVADLLQRRRPELVVSEMTKAERAGKVLIDWSQNDPHKTTVSVYSLRAKEHPTVSTPLHWSEVMACREAHDPALLTFEARQVLSRVDDRGDLFTDVDSLCQRLPVLER